jgi:hypothetical protein
MTKNISGYFVCLLHTNWKLQVGATDQNEASIRVIVVGA